MSLRRTLPLVVLDELFGAMMQTAVTPTPIVPSTADLILLGRSLGTFLRSRASAMMSTPSGSPGAVGACNDQFLNVLVRGSSRFAFWIHLCKRVAQVPGG